MKVGYQVRGLEAFLERVSLRARSVFRDGGAITGCVARRVMLWRSHLRTGEVENKQTHHGFGGN